MDGLGSSVEDVFISPNLHNSPSSALRIAYIIELLYRLTQTCLVLFAIYIRGKVSLNHPLKKFLVLYLGLNSARTLSLGSRIKSKIMAEITSRYREPSGFDTYESLIEMFLFVLYFRGLDYLEICEKCNITEPLLFYLTKSIVILEIALFILPLLMIFLFIMILAHRAELLTLEDISDIP